MAEKKKNTVTAVWELAQPIAEQLGLVLWDVRFIKEGVNWYLRIIIDREDRAVDIDDCVNMSHAIDGPLDELDPIEQAYSLQVQSPGIERELTRDFHFEKYIGEPIMIKFIHAFNGTREYKGTLLSYDNGDISMELPSGDTLDFNKKETSWIKLDDFGGF
ncbi:MAG: ribosome maturation factor RimP [Clostridia bacterium]|nr:ribosome maturation factor RimP [Clostridia bacterium]HAQ63220.1 ribosome maturation factor [Oscillospiraceae bacterium]